MKFAKLFLTSMAVLGVATPAMASVKGDEAIIFGANGTGNSSYQRFYSNMPDQIIPWDINNNEPQSDNGTPERYQLANDEDDCDVRTFDPVYGQANWYANYQCPKRSTITSLLQQLGVIASVPPHVNVGPQATPSSSMWCYNSQPDIDFTGNPGLWPYNTGAVCNTSSCNNGVPAGNSDYDIKPGYVADSTDVVSIGNTETTPLGNVCDCYYTAKDWICSIFDPTDGSNGAVIDTVMVSPNAPIYGFIPNPNPGNPCPTSTLVDYSISNGSVCLAASATDVNNASKVYSMVCGPDKMEFKPIEAEFHDENHNSYEHQYYCWGDTITPPTTAPTSTTPGLRFKGWTLHQ